MTDVSVTLRPPCLCPSEEHKHGISIQSSINFGECRHTSANNVWMKNSGDLILGKVVYISVIYRISDSWVFSLNGYDFYFDHMTGENRELVFHCKSIQLVKLPVQKDSGMTLLSSTRCSSEVSSAQSIWCVLLTVHIVQGCKIYYCNS